MDSKAQVQFLELVPSVHSRVRDWTLRSIRAKDIPAVKTLNDHWLGSRFPKSFYLQFLYDSATTCVVAENAEGVIIGCGTAKVVRRDGLNVNERAGHILTLAVDPTWRRQGLGRDLLEIRTICARLSMQKGHNIVLKSIVLQTSSRNAAALKFYEVCGYQRQGLQTGYYGGGKDAIPMKLNLPERVEDKALNSAAMSRTPSARSWVAVY